MKFYLFALISFVSCHRDFMARGDRDKGGQDHDSWGVGPFRFPSFLKGLSKDAIQAYFTIYKDNSTTIAAQNQEALTWAEQYNLTETVKEYQQNISNFKAAMAKNISDIVSQLPGVLNELQQIFNNDQQTREQIKESFKNLRNTSRVAVRILMAIPFIAKGHHRDEDDKLRGGFQGIHHERSHHGEPMVSAGDASHFGMGSSGGASVMQPMVKKAPVAVKTTKTPKKKTTKNNKNNNA